MPRAGNVPSKSKKKAPSFEIAAKRLPYWSTPPHVSIDHESFHWPSARPRSHASSEAWQAVDRSSVTIFEIL